MSSSDDDLQSYLKKTTGHAGRHQEIDWTKLMESTDLDNDLELNFDKSLNIEYDSSNDESDVNLFLKKPTSNTKPVGSTKETKKLSSEEILLHTNPNIHAVSDFQIESHSSISDPTSFNRGRVQLHHTTNVSETTTSSIAEPVSGNALGESAPQRTPRPVISSDNEHTSSMLSELLSDSLSGGGDIRQNVFSIEQLIGSQSPSHKFQAPSNSLKGELNLHTRDKLGHTGVAGPHGNTHKVAAIGDNPDSSSKDSVKASTEISKGSVSSKSDTLLSLTSQKSNGHTNRFKSLALMEFENHFELHPTSPEPPSDGEEITYSLDKDFDSLSSQTEVLESDYTTVSSVGTGSAFEEKGGMVKEVLSGADEETKSQCSSFSGDTTEPTNSPSTVEPRPSKHKQHPTDRQHQYRRNKTINNKQNVSVQTSPYLNHTDFKPFDVQHPTPILPFVLPAEKIEVLSSYSPHTVALNDLVRSQLSLIRHSMETTRRHVATIYDSTQAGHCYTTLEDTKAYIERNKPKSLTMKEAKDITKRKSYI